ncbi:hypothetical protein J7T55_001292 [Diaporthe amygdali]|uniref:uncharacterized protein n=1 Tax=Phomopsis amygdali TaxID=1214568 RepID=UPI0022FEC4E0|nr:uncharacterized protein J7T55_001292 [Diaporthe amygdali]KAJ0106768.1 hypothetical protein J7T55_001292 [Diaporthe amygdali]
MSAPGQSAANNEGGVLSGSSSDVSLNSILNASTDDQCTDYSDVFPGLWTQDDQEALKELGWEPRSYDERTTWQSYVPYWSHPQWDPEIEIKSRGSLARASRGESRAIMRPMILPGDSDIPRTRYTRAPDGAARRWTQEESIQSYWFRGFTTQETSTYRRQTFQHPVFTHHPAWIMFLRGIYHMRPVSQSADGRTDAEKQHTDYRPYRALWLDIDESQMYDQARALYRRNFDAGRATMGVLDTSLQFSIAEIEPESNAQTTITRDGHIHVILSANRIWPLLVDEYSESEKVAYHVRNAMTILHELAHACSWAHYGMMTIPDVLLTNMPGVVYDQQTRTHLLALRREATGMGDRNYNGRQYFFQDEVQMEEGRAFENQLWGTYTEMLPNSVQAFGIVGNSLRSVLSDNNPASGPGVTAQIQALLRGDLLELYRRLDYEARYTQSIVAEYFLKNSDDPMLNRRSLDMLLGMLRTACDEVRVVLERLTEMRQSLETDPLSRFADIVQECQATHSRINSAFDAISGVVMMLHGNTSLDRSGPNGRGPLASVPIARRDMQESRSLEKAALAELRLIGDPRIRRLLRTWFNILLFNDDIREDDVDGTDVVDGQSLDDLKRARDRETGVAMAIIYLDRLDQLDANRASGLGPTAEDFHINAELQDAMARHQDDTGIADLFSERFTLEEQDRLSRRPTSGG